jgi:hypothetical protein
MIEDAVKDGIYIVEQSYRLRNNNDGRSYGRNNQPEFNKVYAVAVKLNGAYCIDDRILNPWKSDNNYTSLSKSERERYTPVLYKSNYRKIFESKWTIFPLDTLNCTEIVSGRLYRLTDENGAFGFQTDITEGLKKGWLVWVTTQEDMVKQKDVNIGLNIYRSEISITKNEGLYEINQPIFQSNIIGGIYIVPEVNRIGQITFSLFGMIQNINEKWVVITFGDVKEKEKKSADKEEYAPDRLTPIEENED